MEGKEYYEEGLKFAYECGYDFTSKYALYITRYINLKNRKKANQLLVELSSKARIPVSKIIFEDDIATLTFAMGLLGDVTELEHLISVDEAARMWGITPQHVRRLCESGDIRAKKVGRQWIIDKRQENPTLHRKRQFSEIISDRFEDE